MNSSLYKEICVFWLVCVKDQESSDIDLSGQAIIVITVEPTRDSAGRLDETENPTNSVLVKRKRRLAVTRGFDNTGLNISTSQKFITPQNSPAKFHPQAGSTPFSQEVQASRNLAVEIPGISIVRSKSVVQLPNHPPKSPAGATSIRVPVISPRFTPEPSLEWDYDVIQSFMPKVDTQLQTADCLQGKFRN